MMRESERLVVRKVLAFTLLYLVLLGVAGRRAGSLQVMIYLGLMALMVPAVYRVHRRWPLQSSQLWCLSIWGLLHLAGGLLASPDPWPAIDSFVLLYSWEMVPGILRYDQVVHAYGFGVSTWVSWHLLRSRLRRQDGGALSPSWPLLAFCVVAGIGFGALNETVEFITTRFLSGTSIGDYENTGWDLVANLLGATLAVLLIRLRSGSSF
ncbi:MAG: hypothetical protein EAZ65_00985 [Verrucomicrobia bacterium]|nr:MAG: hypothetical protein EAZ84_10405 [Verrucomicrobiota bacterium]TAE89217.1 MAG: hypothetical protein EAZ82_00910 [Verrucomicrobiota bacterium]TAF27907.1 MAG: hypothetical protein EAZ71_00990 [Verrucomicrobiota bacterium]TAF42756.1 MAG: hypothetical protein EAZ65_00985 [Verrucomicrobiota bacterium]